MDYNAKLRRRNYEELKAQINDSHAGAILVIPSIFDVCRSIISVNDLFELANQRGVVIHCSQEEWLKSDSWNEQKVRLVELHRKLIGTQSRKGIIKAIEQGKKVGPKFGTRAGTDAKMRLAASIMEVNKGVHIGKLCEVLDLSIHTFKRLKDEYLTAND